jgi:PEP-CTERM motif
MKWLKQAHLLRAAASLFAVASALSAALPATAGTFFPVAATGFDTDVIFENATPSTASGKFGSRNFAEHGFTSPTIANYMGLNATGEYTVSSGSDTVTFDLEPYTANNIEKIAYSTTEVTSGTLTLNLPLPYRRLALAYSNASINPTGTPPLARAAATFDAIVNYVDMTSDTFPLTQVDWGLTTPAPAPLFDVFNVSRINSADGTLSSNDTANATDVAARWGPFGIILDVNDLKLVQSVTLRAGTAETTGGEAAFFAISGEIVPEPSALALIGLALAALNSGQIVRPRRPHVSAT